MEKEIRGSHIMCMNPRTREPTIILPGSVTQEEHRIVDKMSWQITLWHETTQKVAEGMKPVKE
jgi:hypothetical protein